jgi:hypothetical protein
LKITRQQSSDSADNEKLCLKFPPRNLLTTAKQSAPLMPDVQRGICQPAINR